MFYSFSYDVICGTCISMSGWGVFELAENLGCRLIYSNRTVTNHDLGLRGFPKDNWTRTYCTTCTHTWTWTSHTHKCIKNTGWMYMHAHKLHTCYPSTHILSLLPSFNVSCCFINRCSLSW